jgi:hypothetical protein
LIKKNFVNVLDQTGSAFKYLDETFPPLSEAKIKEGVFVGLQILKLFKEDIYVQKPTSGRREKKLGRVSSGVI